MNHHLLADFFHLCHAVSFQSQLFSGIRVEDFPWAEPWARVTRALGNAVALLSRELSWQGAARHYGLNWKTVAEIVRCAGRCSAGCGSGSDHRCI